MQISPATRFEFLRTKEYCKSPTGWLQFSCIIIRMHGLLLAYDCVGGGSSPVLPPTHLLSHTEDSMHMICHFQPEYNGLPPSHPLRSFPSAPFLSIRSSSLPLSTMMCHFNYSHIAPTFRHSILNRLPCGLGLGTGSSLRKF